MADYSAFPVWGDGEMVSPERLPISRGLRDALHAWNEEWEQWLDTDPDPAVVERWLAEGRQLTARLDVELRAAVDHAVVVTYWHGRGPAT